jgi:putative phage-type endonuclease
MTTTDLAAPAGVLLDTPLVPGSPEWLTKMSASKIAALCGLSTYESPFSLWLRMRGDIPPEPDDDVKRRGHYLEPSIAAWFADQHPDWQIDTTSTWQHRHRDWQIASPDRVVRKPGGVTDLLQCKSANGADGDEWGDVLTDEIPPGVYAQCLWELDVTGFDRCHVAVLGPYLEFAEYVIERDEREQALLRERALAFMQSIERGERPDPDEHGATYQAVRHLHPLIERRDVDLDGDLAVAFCRSRAALKKAEARAQLLTTRVADALGTGRRARHGNRTIAYRAAKGDDGLPYLVAGRNLPDFDTDNGAPS